jgi:hypothetical protein
VRNENENETKKNETISRCPLLPTINNLHFSFHWYSFPVDIAAGWHGHVLSMFELTCYNLLSELLRFRRHKHVSSFNFLNIILIYNQKSNQPRIK